MGSTEQSAADGDGFGIAPPENGVSAGPLVALRNFVGSISPVSIGIAATAILACLLFIASDFQRTLDDAAMRRDLVAEMLGVDPGFGGVQLASLAAAMPRAARARLEGEGLTRVWDRAGAAGFLALFVILATLRRRKSPTAANDDARLDDGLLTGEQQRQLARRYHEEKIRAEAASRAKTSFLAHLSHDVRTPLNHIIGFADLIRHQAYGPLGDARYLNYVDSIKQSGEKLLASFAEILDLAELEGGRKVLRNEPFSADDLLESTARRFGPQAARAGLSISIMAATGVMLVGDRFCLLRMLGNLMDNAIRFTPAGGKINLNAYVGSDGIVIELSDTGIGMTEERLASLSQPFVLGDATFTRKTGGAGLGIAIARAIAELSGGRLAIDSSPALGTTVAISLPAQVEAGAAAA
jgi:signal transduction histidine kinase